ncbi:hypothetical protein FJTKL_00259 [Diaporthe vaccinii]
MSHGITVVTSSSAPFLRHMAQTLGDLGIPANFIAPLKGDMGTTASRMYDIERIRQGQTRILCLCTPLADDSDVIHAVNSAPGGVHRVVVGDASYFSTKVAKRAGLTNTSTIPRFIQETTPKGVVLLASSCHPESLQDVRQAFNLPASSIHGLPPLPPPNLELHAHSSPDNAASSAFLAQLLKRRPGQTVIYTVLEKMANDVAAMLQNEGFSARPVMNTLTDAHGKKALSQFEASEFQILCTTPTVRRLINHPHIRNVVFNAIPSSVSSLDRSLRIAGLDGGWSQVFFIFDAAGLQQSENQIRSQVACRRDVSRLLKEIFQGKEPDQTVYLDLGVLKLDLDMRSNSIQSMLSLLQDRLGLIKLGVKESTVCHYVYTNEGQYNLAKNTSLIDKAIAAHSRKASRGYLLELRGAGMRTTGLDHLQVISRLRELADLGHIELYPGGRKLPVRILRRPSPGSGANSIGALADVVYEHGQQEVEAWVQSRREVIELFTRDRCTTVGFAEYFGAELPGGQKRCERCDWCLTGRPLVLRSGQDEEEIDFRKVRAVLQAIPDRDHPRFLARVATGSRSTRVLKRNLDKSPGFGLLRHANFESLVKVFAKECGVPASEVEDWL